jgi:outer membrane protein TolC
MSVESTTLAAGNDIAASDNYGERKLRRIEMRNCPKSENNSVKLRALRIAWAMVASLLPLFAQSNKSSELALTQGQTASSPPHSGRLTLTLQDALARAQQNDAQFLATVTDAKVAHEDVAQARAAILPSLGLRSEYLGTQGNAELPTGRYVTNDGVHVYREWSVYHQDLSPGTLMRTGYRRAVASEALARARSEIARRGLVVTVTRAYYGLIIAQRKYATAQQAVEQARRSLSISEKLERGGEVAHSDVVKFQLQSEVQDQGFREAKLAMETARLDLAVLLFRDFDEDFEVVDDLHLAPGPPSFEEVQAMAERQSPELRAATNALRGARLDVSIARQAFLPSVAVDTVYGIEANAVALHSTVAAAPQLGPLPNLGYFVTASLTMPVWDWGVRKSKLHQAEFRRQQAGVELSATQRQLIRNLNAFYLEVQTAREQVDSFRHAADLAAESLRLYGLRYQAGEATVLEVVDAQSTLTQARNAYDDSLLRYRVALATLQTLTGSF